MTLCKVNGKREGARHCRYGVVRPGCQVGCPFKPGVKK